MASKNDRKQMIEQIVSVAGNKKITDISADTVETGTQFLNRFVAAYGDVPVVELVNGLWEKRKKSNLVKWLMMQAGLSMDSLADYYGCSKQYLNNKFNRDSFSFEDIVVASYACDYTLALLANDGSRQRKVDAESFFDKDAETWNRISGLKSKSADRKRAEYEQKKAELERMKQEYGFDD